MKAFYISLLILGTILAVNAPAGTVATLQLKGTIAPILDIAVTAEPVATTLPLSTSQSNTKIATAVERSNNLNGYTVNVKSANLGKLVRNATNFVVYTLTYNGQSVTLTSPTGTSFSNNFTNAGPQSKDVRISYTGVNADNLAAGDYTDAITFTISAN